jgi:hypothetical protein
VNREVACEALPAARHPGRHRGGRAPGRRGGGGGRLRPRAHGRLHARARRLRGHAPDPAREAERGLARTPVLALTAHVVGAGAEAWREAGMDGVVHKPFTVLRLAEALAAHLPPADPAAAREPEGRVSEVRAPSAQAPAIPARAPGPAEEPLLDPGIVDQLEGMAATSGRDFIHRVVGLYVDHAPRALDELRGSCEAGRPGAGGAGRPQPQVHEPQRGAPSASPGCWAPSRARPAPRARSRRRTRWRGSRRCCTRRWGALTGHFGLPAPKAGEAAAA